MRKAQQVPPKPKANDLSPEQRRVILVRDERCLACGTRNNLTIQHRVGRGMGGLGTRAEPLVCYDAIILCWDCNVAAEGPMQREAVMHGWKVPRHSILPTRLVPVFDRLIKQWYALGPDGEKWPLPARYAEDLCMEVYEAWRK